MKKIVAMSGNMAIANAMRQINPHVCAAYPITPSTEIMQEFANFVAEGLVDTELVAAESEHSAMSACIGASAAGGRVMTATSAQGLALMWEMLYVAASCRLPIVISVVNRALNAPLNIHCDHSDSMGARDAGLIQLYAENAQEAYDNTIQAIRIGEDLRVRLPVMTCMDGFIISHSIERMEMLEDGKVKEFIGSYAPYYPLLDLKNPVTYGPVDLPNYYIEHKRQQVEAMKNAKNVIEEIGGEFGKEFGRPYGFMEGYELWDAEIAVVAMSSAVGVIRAAVKELRRQGIRAGLLKLRVFRPFPAQEIAEKLTGVKAVAVLDRADSFGGFGGPLFTETRSALYGINGSLPMVMGRIFGLGGRDLMMSDVDKVYKKLLHVLDTGEINPVVDYITVRE